jgi:hypothetical protein
VLGTAGRQRMARRTRGVDAVEGRTVHDVPDDERPAG